MDIQQQIEQYRLQIDEVDRRIVDLLAERTALVRELMVYKTDEEAVRGCDRVQQVIDKIRKLATKKGMPEEIAEHTYRALIEALTEMQLQYLKNRQSADATQV